MAFISDLKNWYNRERGKPMSGLPGLRTIICCLSLFAGPLCSDEAAHGNDSQATAAMGTADSNKTSGKGYNKGKSRPVKKYDDEPFYEQTTYRSTAAIMRSLRPNSPILNKEYLAHFSGKVHPKGTITTKIFIDPDGRVIKARIIGDSIKDTAFAAKTTAFFKDLRFDPIKRKVIDSVSIPFSFPP